MIFTAAQLSALPVLDTCDVLIAGAALRAWLPRCPPRGQAQRLR